MNFRIFQIGLLADLHCDISDSEEKVISLKHYGRSVPYLH